MSVSDEYLWRHTESVSKGTATLLAAAGAGIGFALHETADRPMSHSLVIIGGAAVLWAVSFASGIFRSNSTEVALHINGRLAQASELRISAELQKPLRDRFGTVGRRAFLLQQIQLWTLLIGGVTYMVGAYQHVQETTAKAKVITVAAAPNSPALAVSPHPHPSPSPALMPARPRR